MFDFKKFNTTVDDLKRLNNLSDNAISIGQFIKVK
ncbi:LysM peptidoglycan-binding domain-containing protein [Flavobacterium lindanitolerans]|nr:LysM peptidoglycan-binding domain-containing protein [Flavobacterium lindanitolerans]